MNNKCTIEDFMLDLRPAMQAAGLSDSDFAKVRDQLTKSEHEFREGEVVCCTQTGNYYRVATQCGLPADRPLRLSEMPKAVEDLREAANMCECSHTVAHAIAAFDEVIEP